MKRNFKTRIFALVMCVAMIVTLMPSLTFAEVISGESGTYDIAPEGSPVAMTEGDVQENFVPEGTLCVSSDPAVAWVDSSGSLKALKAGTAVITVQDDSGLSADYQVTVSDYTDGSPVVGKIKILARYNDSMQFYDGHSYFLFTSYQDGVDVTVNNLYGAYEISDQYYDDIREDIANGSNHTGNDAEKYFTFTDDPGTWILDRGEIVTIGMYRDFDLTVPQAALGSLKNSTAWTELVKAGKTGFVENVFSLLTDKQLTVDEAIARLSSVLEETGSDYHNWLDGVVTGGLCFNRELYNQKLEWDQYENVTYEMDITETQLKTLIGYLNDYPSYNNFSILKNSCATVMLNAWNYTFGTRNNEDTAYKLDIPGEGIYTFIDAPKTVRDNITGRLPGYYLNNAEGVAEPDAGFTDDTGAVYVSAPEKVSPVNYTYENPGLIIDTSRTKMADLVNAAKAGSSVVYNVDSQDIGVTVNATALPAGSTVLSSIDFDINGTKVSLNETNMTDEGIWFKVSAVSGEGEKYYVTDAEGKALPSEYAEGELSFYAEKLPVIYMVTGSESETYNILSTTVLNNQEAGAETAIYYKDSTGDVDISDGTEVASGTKVYIKTGIASDNMDYIVSELTLNKASILDDEHYDETEGAFFFEMPEKYSKLRIDYSKAMVVFQADETLQLSVGDVLDLKDYAKLYMEGVESDRLKWYIHPDTYDMLEYCDDENQIRIKKAGRTVLGVCACENENIGDFFIIEAYDNLDDLVKISYSYSDNDAGEFKMTVSDGDGKNEREVPCSGYLVPKGSVLTVVPDHELAQGKILIKFSNNGKALNPGESIIADEDINITAQLAGASIKGLPRTVTLNEKGAVYQLNAEVQYTSLLNKLRQVYDPDIRYISSDPLVEVDENGLIKAAGDIPEEGKAVYVTAYAGTGCDTVSASTKVVLGDYDGEEIVGSLTLSARSIAKTQLIAHSAATFTTYKDLDLNVSFYEYYKFNDKFAALLKDYEDNPEKYPSDPALYSEDIDLGDRYAYVDAQGNEEARSEARKVSLKAGESISVSNYGFEDTNLTHAYKAIDGGEMGSLSEAAEVLVEQAKLYQENGIDGIDGEKAFDSLVSTLMEMFLYTEILGENPAGGDSTGGLILNREMYNQFRRDDSQFPNNYYTVEITADELANIEKYLADPNNNYYSLFNKNCASGAKDIWNAALEDRPELQVRSNYLKITDDPQSMYFELGLLRLKSMFTDLPGRGGTNFYPRTQAYIHSWNVEADGDTLTLQCTNTDSDHYDGNCKYHEGIDIVLSADACDFKHVTADGLEEFNDIANREVLLNSDYVKFYRTDEEGVTEGGTEVPAGTHETGDYYAELTINGQSAKAAFAYDDTENTIKKAFEEYQEKLLTMLDAIKLSTDSEAVTKLINQAKEAVKALSVDVSQTIEENEAALYNIYLKFLELIQKQRQSDELAPVKEQTRLALELLESTQIKAVNSLTGISSIKKAAYASKINAEADKAETDIDNAGSVTDVAAVLSRATNSIRAIYDKAQKADAKYVLAKNKAVLNAGSKITVSGKGVLTLKWGKVEGADGYEVYVRADNKSIFKKVTATVKSGSTTTMKLKKLNGRKISASKQYSFAVKAYKMVSGRKTYIATGGKYAAVGPSHSRYTNVKKVVPKKKSLSLSVGKTASIKKSLKKSSAKKKLSNKTKKVIYVSSDTNVATVTAKGKVKALEKGTCRIYVIAANGIKKAVKVTVK